ncbi:MFS transporter [Streptomyces sp. TLI_171]|uniref:MFS transporter n=1 Tax=Streptomyces sp. TLI_171 TaxID=1938859 RepID=UPI000C197ABC|nr:MFS transporter [Streptomyces sp. TLI_171]RKE17708.1 EmrB/QacA subfamily drug resistance transporter [Streptomyces sp. TLI_171]
MTTPAPSPRRWWALGALVLSVLVVGLDGTIVNVALPTLAADLGADSSQLLWIGGGYLLTFSVAMLPVGRLGDRHGHRRLLLTGLALFGLTSLAGALVHSPGAVIAVRTALGLGAAMILPISMALLPRIFAKEEISKAIAVWTAAAAVGMPAGPVVGGWLLDHYWWGSVFLFNLPVVALALVASRLLLAADPEPAGAAVPFDTLGTVLSAVGITSLVYGTIMVPTDGWADPVVVGALLAGAVLLAGFLLHQRRTPGALVDLGLFTDRSFAWGTLTAVFGNFAIMGILFVVPQYLAAVQGFDAFGTGLRVLPLIGGLMVSAGLSEGLVPRLGARTVVPAGLLLLAAGALLGAATGTGSGYGFTALWLAVLGVGFGLAVVPSTSLVLATLPEDDAGAGTSLLETLQQVGGVLGVAGLGSLLSAGYLGRIDVHGLPAPAAATARDSVAAADAVARELGDPALLASAHGAFVHGMSQVLTACGAVAVLAAVLAAVFLPGRPKGVVEPQSAAPVAV